MQMNLSILLSSDIQVVDVTLKHVNTTYETSFKTVFGGKTVVKTVDGLRITIRA